MTKLKMLRTVAAASSGLVLSLGVVGIASASHSEMGPFRIAIARARASACNGERLECQGACPRDRHHHARPFIERSADALLARRTVAVARSRPAPR